MNEIVFRFRCLRLKEIFKTPLKSLGQKTFQQNNLFGLKNSSLRKKDNGINTKHSAVNSRTSHNIAFYFLIGKKLHKTRSSSQQGRVRNDTPSAICEIFWKAR